jgi:hypothetical protein
MPLGCALCRAKAVELIKCAGTSCSEGLCQDCVGPNRTGGLCPRCWQSAIAELFSITSFQRKRHATFVNNPSMVALCDQRVDESASQRVGGTPLSNQGSVLSPQDQGSVVSS